MATKSVKKKSARKVSAGKVSRASARVEVGTREQAIALRAYRRWEARGCVHGFDVEDWLAAEREL